MRALRLAVRLLVLFHRWAYGEDVQLRRIFVLIARFGAASRRGAPVATDWMPRAWLWACYALFAFGIFSTLEFFIAVSP